MFSLASFFDESLKELNCSDDTRAYVVGVFAGFRKSEGDLSNHSITLLFAEARKENCFAKFQTIGDYLLFCRSIFPEFLVDASDDYYLSIGQSSYYACYKLLQRQWKVFDELADRLPSLTEASRQLLSDRIYPTFPSIHGINFPTV
jgi:hypothetical protein